MSDSTATSETELEAAIAENPDAVADFVRRLDAVNELLDVLSLGESALTDEMVRELAGTTATLAESADGIATEETVGLAASIGQNGEELEEALETLVVLQRSGTLDELVELAESAADGDTRDGIETVLDGIGAAETETPERVGPIGLLRASRDPDVQHGLGYLLAIAGAIGRSKTRDGAE